MKRTIKILKMVKELNKDVFDNIEFYLSGTAWELRTDGSDVIVCFFSHEVWSSARSLGTPTKKRLLELARVHENVITSCLKEPSPTENFWDERERQEIKLIMRKG